MIEPAIDTQPDETVMEIRPRQSKFAVDVLKLVSGTTAAQIISVLAAPVMARLFDPDAFGVFALFSSVVGILAAVFTLEYELAIMLPKDDSDAANLVAGSMLIATLFSLLTIPIVWFAGPEIVQWLNAPDLAPFLWFLPVLLFFGGIGSGHPVLNVWASRTRLFTQISATQVASTLTSTLAKVGAGLVGFNSGGGLIGGTLAGSILSPVLLGLRIWKRNKDLFLENVRWLKMVENLKRYRKFAIYNTPSALLNAASWQVPSLLLAFFFSPAIVGFYSFGNQLLRVPMNLIGSSIAQAFFPHATTARHQGTLAEFVEATFRRLVEYGFFPILVLTIVGKELCIVVFGNQWAEAGVYIQILGPWTFFWFISSPMSRLYSVLEKNELALRLNLFILISRVLSIWAGGVIGDPRLALAFFSVSGVMMYGYLSFMIVSLSGVSWLAIGRIFLSNAILALPVGGLLIALKLLGLDAWVQVVVSGLVVGFYFLYLFQKDGYWKQIASNLFKKKPLH